MGNPNGRPRRQYLRDACVHDHPYAPGSYRVLKNGQRICNECNSAQQSVYRRRVKTLTKNPPLRQVCRICKVELPAAAFSLRNDVVSGISYVCRACVRIRNRDSEYGLQAGEYDRILFAQGGRCAICRNYPEEKALGVDHSHVTGAIRGLLCHACNASLGLLHEDIAVLARAVDYLQSFQACHELDLKLSGRAI